MDRRRGTRKKKLYSTFVGNIPLNITKDQLEEMFDHCGKIEEVSVATPSQKMKYKFGFVRFGTQEEVLRAVREMDGWPLGSMKLKVEVESATSSAAKAPKQKSAGTSRISQEALTWLTKLYESSTSDSEVARCLLEASRVRDKLLPAYSKAPISLLDLDQLDRAAEDHEEVCKKRKEEAARKMSSLSPPKHPEKPSSDIERAPHHSQQASNSPIQKDIKQCIDNTARLSLGKAHKNTPPSQLQGSAGTSLYVKQRTSQSPVNSGDSLVEEANKVDTIEDRTYQHHLWSFARPDIWEGVPIATRTGDGQVVHTPHTRGHHLRTQRTPEQ